MKTLMINAGFTEQGIAKFISTIESILPHMPGNWNFIGTNEKLSFIAKNKITIKNYIDSSKPIFTNEENEGFPAIFNDDEKSRNRAIEKNNRFVELRSADQTLRMF
jgi:hypothetical protein